MKLRTIVIDDENLALQRFLGLLKNYKNIIISGYTTNPEKGMEMVISEKPDILFLDVEMPVISGFDFMEEIRKKGINPEIIFITGYGHYAIKAIKKQAFDYLLKPIDIDELNECVNRIIDKKNNNVIIPENIRELLSEREIEIVKLLKKGKTSQQIGKELYISKKTVDTHRRNILEKTGFNSTSELIGLIY